MANNDTGESPYPVSFRFELSFRGEDAAFQEVLGISKEMNVEEVACGGENRFKYRLPTASSTKNLILKRALIPKGSKLAQWCAYTLDSSLVYAINTKDVRVRLLNAKGASCIEWTFYGAYPVKYSISDLKSTENQLAIESIELAYRYFEIPKNK